MTLSPRSPSSSGFPHDGASKDTSRRQPERQLIHDGGDGVEEALLPPTKRATSDSSGHSSHSDDSSAPPKKRWIDYVDIGSKDGGTSETPVPRYHNDAAGNTVVSPNPAEEEALSQAEKLLLLKGKIIATEESSSMANAAVASEPPQEKLMQDGIRSGVRFDEYLLQVPGRQGSTCNSASGSASLSRIVMAEGQAHACSGASPSTSGSLRLMDEGHTYACNVASANGSPRLMEEGQAYAAVAAPAKKKKKKNNKVDACSGMPPARGIPFDKVRTSMALRDSLEELHATEPEYVCEKMLQMSDVCRNQSRLLFSCKGEEELASCPITLLFTKKEKLCVHDKGLEVTVFDCRGNKYAMKCRYLVSNGGYRFITQWGVFLNRNSLYLHGGKWTRQVDVELWAFRSWRLPKLPEGEETGHPDGSLGLILLHYERGRRVVDGGEEKWKPALPVNQTNTQHMASASAVVKKEELAGAAEAGTRGITREEMAATVGEDTLGAAIGILKLSRCHERISVVSSHSPSSSKC